MPGSVTGVDESLGGFSMLPSDWPSNFNEKFLKRHKIQGSVSSFRVEYRTVYHLHYDDGKLVWHIEGTDIRREWEAE
jgi:hypothetical protein